MPVSEPRMSVREPRMPVSKPRTSVSEPRMPVSEPRVPVSEPRMPVREPRVPAWEARMPVREARVIYRVTLLEIARGREIKGQIHFPTGGLNGSLSLNAAILPGRRLAVPGRLAMASDGPNVNLTSVHRLLKPHGPRPQLSFSFRYCDRSKRITAAPTQERTMQDAARVPRGGCAGVRSHRCWKPRAGQSQIP